MAISSLKEGKSVFIDRCNLNREQRSEFVKLGGPGIEVHAVVLKLPAQVCISRSVKRTGHEGNLQGGRAAAVGKLRSEGGLHCNVIANATNWRLKHGGGGVNAAIFKAAGPDLETATRVRANTLLPGIAVVVPLPSTCPLHNAEGITHVIHVLGPNMNPNRPDNLNNDYTKGCI
ncbi:PREDICTED: transcription factor bHLH140-like [Camelina sativa]|uniref:Transcription factor bHLH140-like n=1 Tax=Camelina sativa TaxID=90675 RepID=A0ABM1R2N5_CAMSA|nr:PREDICTED: transcription factor bHLH140-like [Camelina sativa]